MHRREFLSVAAGGLLSGLAPATIRGDAPDRPRRLLLRSSWQTVNIGDIAHTPGMLRLLELHLPDVQVTLWPSKVDNGVAAMLRAAFPKLRIAEGRVGKDGKPTTEELRRAWDESDFCLHGSGPSVVAAADVRAWHASTGRPYGIYGVTVNGAISPELRRLLDGAQFLYCRDTDSLKHIKAQGVKSRVMDFAPDATFALHLRDDRAAETSLKSLGLEAGSFVCAIPRLRYTPYFKIHNRKPTAEELKRDAISEEYKERDHAKLRDALVTLVRQTPVRVLACPEMTHEVALAKELLVDPVPAEVRSRFLHRDRYWRPDEATSVYARSLAVVSFEMHSPIMAVAAGVPAIYLRQPTDTTKGQMWRDIGLNDWIFEIDATDAQAVARALLAIQSDPAEARARVARASEFVKRRQRESMEVVGKALAG